MQIRSKRMILFLPIIISLCLFGIFASRLQKDNDAIGCAYQQAFAAIDSDDAISLASIYQTILPVEMQNHTGTMNLLTLAIERGSIKSNPPIRCIEVLIKNGADVNSRSIVNGKIVKPIIVCFKLRSYACQIAQMLLDNGASFIDEDSTDRICLSTALGNEELFNFYLSKGARSDICIVGHPLKCKTENYCIFLAEEALVRSDVSLDMFRKIVEMHPWQVKHINPVGFVESFGTLNVKEKEKQLSKILYAIDNGLMIHEKFPSRIFGSKQSKSFYESVKESNEQLLIVLQGKLRKKTEGR